jgi:hypothetical protein
MAGGPSSTPSPFSRFRAFSLPASTTMSSASIFYASCSHSPSLSAAETAGAPPPPSPSMHARGRAASGPLPTFRDHPRVRASPLMLPHPSIAADEASAGRNRELRRAPLFSSRPRTTGTNSTRSRGFSAELMTQMNSASRIYLFWRNAGTLKIYIKS